MPAGAPEGTSDGAYSRISPPNSKMTENRSGTPERDPAPSKLKPDENRRLPAIQVGSAPQFTGEWPFEQADHGAGVLVASTRIEWVRTPFPEQRRRAIFRRKTLGEAKRRSEPSGHLRRLFGSTGSNRLTGRPRVM